MSAYTSALPLIDPPTAPYVLAYDSDDDCDYGDKTTVGRTPPTKREQSTGEDSRGSQSAAGLSAESPSAASRHRGAADQKKALKSSRGRGRCTITNATDRTAASAECLLKINALATDATVREAALAQLGRFRGAYQPLCRGAPFSVWVRYEPVNETVVDQTAEFFSAELEELVRARQQRTAQGAPPPKPEFTSESMRAARVTGCRQPMPWKRSSFASHPNGEAAVAPPDETDGCAGPPRSASACPLWESGASTRGELAAVSLLSMDEIPECTAAHPLPDRRTGKELPQQLSCAQVLECSVLSAPARYDELSPFCIYDDGPRLAPYGAWLDGSRPGCSGEPAALRPATKRGRASCGANATGNSTRGCMSSGERTSPHAAPFHSARKLDFGPSTNTALPPEGPQAVSLSQNAVAHQNQRVIQEWFRSSQDAFRIPF